MFSILIRKYASDSWLLLLCSSIILVTFTWVRIWTVAQFELSSFAPLIENFRMFEKFSPVPLEQFLTYEGVIGLSFAEPILLLCVITWSISRGSDVVSGELNRGTLEMLLAQPIKRASLIAAHAIVSIVGLAILCCAAFLGIVGGIYTNSTVVTSQPNSISVLGFNVASLWNSEPIREVTPLADLVPLHYFIAPTINLFALGFFLLALSVMVSAMDQYRWRTIGIVIGIYILQALLFVLGKSNPRTKFLIPFSFLAAYQPDWMVQAVARMGMSNWTFAVASDQWLGFQFGPAGYSAVLIGLGLVCYGVAFYKFARRDLPAPT